MQAAVLATVAEQSWAFSAAPVIIDLAKSLASDPEALSKLSMDRTSASYKMNHGLAESFRQRTLNILRKVKFSLNIDEATSSGTKRVLTILVNYVDPVSKRPTLEHLGSVNLVRVDSVSVFKAVDDLFTTNNIPWYNCMSMLMDSCAVMRGCKSGLEEKVRTARAPHLLDIDGDVCHHLHNACKEFCKPFENWGEGLFHDIYSEFHWSSSNQDALKEIFFILGEKFSMPTQFVSHRWLSCYDAAQNTLLSLKALTLFCFAYLSSDDKKLYRETIDLLCSDISIPGQKRLRELQTTLGQRQRTAEGKKRHIRLTDKLFVHRAWTQSVLGVYTAVLAVLKEYVCLFQKSECMVHKLHDEQEKVFRKFLTMFVLPQQFSSLSVDQLKDSEKLTLEASTCQPLREMFVGTTAEKAMKAWDRKRKEKFLQVVQSAYLACGRVLQKKLPLNNQLLMAASVIDPACDHNHSTAKAAFNRLPKLATNVVQLEKTKELYGTELERQNDARLDAYSMEVLAYCSSQDFGPPSKMSVCEWWNRVEQTGNYPLLSSVVAALMSCFHGPAVESSFSVMKMILDDKSSRLSIDTYSALQTVKYSLRSSGKTAVQCFSRKDIKHTPVNHQMCRLLRGSAAAYKSKQNKAREEKEAKQALMSQKHQAEVSRLRLKALQAEAERQARLAHKRKMTARLNLLATNRKRCGTDSRKPPAKKAKHQ